MKRHRNILEIIEHTVTDKRNYIKKGFVPSILVHVDNKHEFSLKEWSCFHVLQNKVISYGFNRKKY